jgi:hypothetical protein
VLEVADEDLPDLGQTIKMVVTFWIAYQIAQAPGTRVTKALLYKGILRILFLLRPYLRAGMRSQIESLEAHYRALAG